MRHDIEVMTHDIEVMSNRYRVVFNKQITLNTVTLKKYKNSGLRMRLSVLPYKEMYVCYYNKITLNNSLYLEKKNAQGCGSSRYALTK
jgi:hypothetical protein